MTSASRSTGSRLCILPASDAERAGVYGEFFAAEQHSTSESVAIAPELVGALDNLHDFACTFYNNAAMYVLHVIQRFINSFACSGEPDRDTTKRLFLWINTK